MQLNFVNNREQGEVMAIYVFIYLIVMVLAIINITYVKKEKLSFFYVLVCIYLVMFTGLRDGLGGYDYFQYKAYFDAIPPLEDINLLNLDFYKYESGYTLLNSLLKSFTENSHVLFIVVSIITLGGILILNYKYSRYPFFTLQFFLYKMFLYNNFVALRQSFVIAIFIFAIKFIEKRNFKKYILCIIVSMLFHLSAIVLIPVYFINRVDLRKVEIKKILLVCIGGFLFSNIMFDLIMSLVSLFGKTRYMNYSSGSTMAFYLNILEGLMFLFLIKKFNKMDKELEKINYNLVVLYFAITVIFMNYSFMARVTMNFIFPMILLFGDTLKYMDGRKKKIAFFLLFSFLFFAGYIRELLTFDGGSLKIYSSILFK